MIEKISADGKTLAIILRHTFIEPGIHFFTPGEYSQQLGFMSHPKGRKIQAHLHNEVPRAIMTTQEVLFVRRGRLRVDFFTQNKQYLESRILEPGDVILLACGGHGFEVLEDLEMVEVKQGPYVGDRDKTRFTPEEIDAFIFST